MTVLVPYSVRDVIKWVLISQLVPATTLYFNGRSKQTSLNKLKREAALSRWSNIMLGGRRKCWLLWLLCVRAPVSIVLLRSTQRVQWNRINLYFMVCCWYDEKTDWEIFAVNLGPRQISCSGWKCILWHYNIGLHIFLLPLRVNYYEQSSYLATFNDQTAWFPAHICQREVLAWWQSGFNLWWKANLKSGGSAID
jgi:hypothetical protein